MLPSQYVKSLSDTVTQHSSQLDTRTAITGNRFLQNMHIPAATLKTSLAGKIRNLRHFKSEALLPVFEAVVNSIQAIEEAGNLSQGVISVKVKRDLRQGNLRFDDDDSLPPITGYEIEDNGIGFNDDNFESFETSDSTYKLVESTSKCTT